MASAPDTFDAGGAQGLRRWLPLAIGIVLAIGAAVWIYRQMTAVQGVKVEAPSPTMIDMLPPPPPPPPPPPEPQPKPPEPTDAPDPVPNPAPAPKAAEAPAPMTIAGPAQAGTDSFGLSAGSGAGTGAPGGTGTCLGTSCGTGGGGGGISDAFYTRYLSGALQERVQGNDRVNRQTFSATFAIRIAGGRVVAAQLVKSSGKSTLDAQLKAILEATGGLDAPPAGWNGRAREITVRGRRAI